MGLIFRLRFYAICGLAALLYYLIFVKFVIIKVCIHELIHKRTFCKVQAAGRSQLIRIFDKRKNVEDNQWLKTQEGTAYSDYGDGTCATSEHRQPLKELFLRWIKVSKKLDIPYFVYTGSLLGAWRNGDIIPHDRDVDVMINRKDAVKLEQIKEKRNFKETDKNFHLVLQEDWRLLYGDRRRFLCNGKQVLRYSDHCSFQEPLARIIKNDHHIDIYDYQIINNTFYDHSEWIKTFPINSIFPLKKCKFMKTVTYCPNTPRVVLDEFYSKNLYPLAICKNGTWMETEGSPT